MIRYSRTYELLHMFTVIGKTTTKFVAIPMLSFIKMACLIKLKETKTSSKYRGEGASSVLAVLTSLGLRGSCPQTTFISKLYQTFISQMYFSTDCYSLTWYSKSII